MAIPDTSTPIPDPLSSEKQKQILLPTDKWTDDYALRVVKSDWAYAESYRINAHDWRYRNADELYLAWAGQQFWEGTRVPRSSLGIYVVFEQVEAMLPKIVSAVSSSDAYHFEPEGGSDDQTDLAVTAWREMVLAQLDEADWREQVRRAVKSMEIYGNGVLEVGVEEREEEFVSFDRQVVPTQVAQMNHPIAGPFLVPTQTKESFKRTIKREKKLKPYVRYVSVKDLYIDPNCESADIQNSAYVIKRTYMRAEQLKMLTSVKDFNIPDDMYLANLSKSKSTANQDVTKLAAELYRYNMWNPSQDYTSDPSQKRIAVVEYTTPSRKVWWLQGQDDTKAVIYNQPNRYGQINFFNCTYADVLDRWHALSISDVAEGEQRLQAAIINGRVDELALGLHPPMKKRRGITVPWYQLKRAPGRVTEVEDPEKDIVESDIHNITQQAFIEVSASENRVQKITGLTDLAALGTPSSGGNSANRTATGVNTQAGATQDRMKYIVENVESSLIEPAVNFIIKCNQKFLDPKEASNKLKLDPRFAKLDPVKVMNTRVVAECRASIKMAGRLAFMQTFPTLAQVYMNPEFLQIMAQTHQMSLDPKAVERTLWDAINYTPRDAWFIPMSQQQIQQMQQPPADVRAQLAMQDSQIQSDENIEGMRLKAKMLDSLLKEFFESHRHMAELDDNFNIEQMANATQLQAAKLRPKPTGGAGKSNSASK